MRSSTLFLSFVGDSSDLPSAKLMIDSLRAFGGEFSDCSVWVFYPAHLKDIYPISHDSNVRMIPAEIEEPYRSFPFAYKPLVAAYAEAVRPHEVDTFVWMDFASVILRPPNQFARGSSIDIALRPVHVRNIGLPISGPLDSYWSEIYRAVGMDTPQAHCVIPVTESESIRAYFNCSQYSVKGSLDLYRGWRDCFKALVSDKAFQSHTCDDDLHRIFLHQAIFSALILKLVPWNRIRMLPPTYGYPLHLQKELAAVNRTVSPKEVVSALTYGEVPRPEQPFFSQTEDSFKAWLSGWLRENS